MAQSQMIPKQVAPPQVFDVMMEESKDEGNNCPYCNKGFTPQEEAANLVNMFLTTECYH